MKTILAFTSFLGLISLIHGEEGTCEILYRENPLYQDEEINNHKYIEPTVATPEVERPDGGLDDQDAWEIEILGGDDDDTTTTESTNDVNNGKLEDDLTTSPTEDGTDENGLPKKGSWFGWPAWLPSFSLSKLKEWVKNNFNITWFG